MIREGNKLIHWNYFLALDADAERLSRYVEFTKDNFESYSIEMARLILTAASEADVVAKLLCDRIDPSKKAKRIDKYRSILNTALPKIKGMKVLIPRYGLELVPWENWEKNETPNWWLDYNAVKHERNVSFQKANLENTINSIAGLFCLLMYYYAEEVNSGNLIPDPTLFTPSVLVIDEVRWAMSLKP